MDACFRFVWSWFCCRAAAGSRGNPARRGSSAGPDSGQSGAPQTAVWDGSIAGSFAGGDGSEADPFRIETASQLAFLAREVNGGKDYAGKYVSMVCDVDLNHVEWTPIGNGTHSFSGIFHGNGHTVSNLKMTDGAPDLPGSFPRPRPTSMRPACLVPPGMP